MADIRSGLINNELQKQKTKNKLLRQEIKYMKKIQTEREAYCKAAGKVNAYQEILVKRYDKLDNSFLAFVYFAAILIWLL